jgi:hypothetical protein
MLQFKVTSINRRTFRREGNEPVPVSSPQTQLLQRIREKI